MKMKFVIPGLPLALRLPLWAASQIGGLNVALFQARGFFSPEFLLGMVILAAGSVLLIARGYHNKPLDLGFEDWQPVTIAEFDRLRDNLAVSRKLRYPLYYKPHLGALLYLLGIFLCIMMLIGDEDVIPMYVLSALIVLYPFLLTGVVILWTPQDMNMKMACFAAVLQAAKQAVAAGKVAFTPHLRLDKDKEGRRIPEDVRLMIEPRRKREGFMGVQLQVAVNRGPKGAVPYLYAVFLCQAGAKALEALTAADFSPFLAEPGGDADYGYVVVRQQTGGTGYQTEPRDCVALYEKIQQILAAL